MKLLMYKGKRPGMAGIGDWLVRKRTKSPYSHCEILFEESDGDVVAQLMPNGSLKHSPLGAQWCFSASATDRMPAWNTNRKHRAGSIGGTRFKQIVYNPERWDVIDIPFVDPLEVALFCVKNEGRAYDWRHIFSFFSIILVGVILNFFINQGEDHWTCGEVCGAALGLELPEIFDPKTLGAVVASMLTAWLYFNRAKTGP